jgi:hypothetical protein
VSEVCIVWAASSKSRTLLHRVSTNTAIAEFHIFTGSFTVKYLLRELVFVVEQYVC